MQVIQKLRQSFPLELLLDIAQLPRATYYYHVKRQAAPDKYLDAQAAITGIYHENKAATATGASPQTCATEALASTTRLSSG